MTSGTETKAKYSKAIANSADHQGDMAYGAMAVWREADIPAYNTYEEKLYLRQS